MTGEPAGRAALPEVAVLLSTWNGAAFLEPQLDSLRAQRGVRVMLHARDDGSTDATCAILRDHADTWPTLAGITPGPNLGPAASFLHLLRTAPDGAGYFAFCDQDDVWLEDKLARAVAALAGARGPALYCSNITCVDAGLAPLGTPPPQADTRFAHLLFENVATGCTVVLNRAARDLVNNRPPERGLVMHDWWCALVIGALGQVIYDPQPSLLYRQHGGNAVGNRGRWWAEKASHARRLFARRRSFYPIHAQAAELLRLHGAEMAPGHRTLLARLVGSRRSPAARAGYALAGPVVRRNPLDAAVVRGLILAGWY